MEERWQAAYVILKDASVAVRQKICLLPHERKAVAKHIGEAEEALEQIARALDNVGGDIVEAPRGAADALQTMELSPRMRPAVLLIVATDAGLPAFVRAAVLGDLPLPLPRPWSAQRAVTTFLNLMLDPASAPAPPSATGRPPQAVAAALACDASRLDVMALCIDLEEALLAATGHVLHPGNGTAGKLWMSLAHSICSRQVCCASWPASSRPLNHWRWRVGGSS